MAYTKVVFENPTNGHIKEAPIGFSWTSLIFGFFVPLFRGSWKFTIIMITASLFTFGLSNLVFPFIFNRLYVNELISLGFKAKSIETGSFDELSTKLGIKIPLSNDHTVQNSETYNASQHATKQISAEQNTPNTVHNILKEFSIENEVKKCSSCAEVIKLEAQKCRYCGEVFSEESVQLLIDDKRNVYNAHIDKIKREEQLTEQLREQQRKNGTIVECEICKKEVFKSDTIVRRSRNVCFDCSKKDF